MLLGALALVVCYARVYLGYHDAAQVCAVLKCFIQRFFTEQSRVHRESPLDNSMHLAVL